MNFVRLICGLFLSIAVGLTPAFSQDKRVSLTPLSTLYDYHLIETDSQTPISLANLVKKLADKDVIFIGEFHGNHAIHLFQAQLQARLYQQTPHQVLSMEQFNRDQQTILNRYLDSEIGEKTLIKEAPTWSNYAGSYRPVIEFAKRHFIPVVAANAPANTVRCVGRLGKNYLKKLADSDLQYIPSNPFYSDPAYQAQFEQFMQAGKASHKRSSQSNNSYFAQLLRDNSMAESINSAYQQSPISQILHLNGAFHSNSGLGTVAALKHRNPKLNIAIISPVSQKQLDHPHIELSDLKLGDYLLIVPAQPDDYVQAAKRRAAMKAMFENAKSKPCL